MNTVHWPQERVEARTMDQGENATIKITTCGNPSISSSSSFVVEKERVELDQKQDMKHGINCRRCSSTNTKFCYYNNYSLSQPRYFCKTCKRYWTEGGSLRNIPVGGVSRSKNVKRSSPSNSDSNSSPPPTSKKMLLIDDHHTYNQHQLAHQNPNNNIQISEEAEDQINIRHDLNLGLIPSEQNVFKTITELIQVPDFDKNNTLFQQYHPALFNMPSNHYHELANFHDQEADNRRPALLFPFQEIKQVERKTSDSGGYRINGGGVLGSGLW